MGVDIEIAIGLKKKPSREVLERAKNLYKDCSVIDGDLYEGVDNIEGIEKYEITLGISSCTRLYCDGYERGPFISIYGTLVFLAKYFKKYEPTIYYGGDCYEYIPEVNFNQLEELMNYFIENGEAPYRGTNYDQAQKNV